MFVAPNPIDFSKALVGFAEAFQSGNVVVMFTIITLLILYTLLAVWAWRTDRRDALQVRKYATARSHVDSISLSLALLWFHRLRGTT